MKRSLSLIGGVATNPVGTAEKLVMTCGDPSVCLSYKNPIFLVYAIINRVLQTAVSLFYVQIRWALMTQEDFFPSKYVQNISMEAFFLLFAKCALFFLQFFLLFPNIFRSSGDIFITSSGVIVPADTI